MTSYTLQSGRIHQTYGRTPYRALTTAIYLGALNLHTISDSQVKPGHTVVDSGVERLPRRIRTANIPRAQLKANEVRGLLAERRLRPSSTYIADDGTRTLRYGRNGRTVTIECDNNDAILVAKSHGPGTTTVREVPSAELRELAGELYGYLNGRTSDLRAVPV